MVAKEARIPTPSVDAEPKTVTKDLKKKSIYGPLCVQFLYSLAVQLLFKKDRVPIIAKPRLSSVCDCLI